MKIASFEANRVGVILEDQIVDITDLITKDSAAWPPVAMLKLISEFEKFRPQIEAVLPTAARQPLASVRLRTPVPWPNKIVAYPANFHAHINEMVEGTGLISTFPASGQGFFLKPPSALSGPNDPIVLPNVPGREIHHECEIAIIIGKGGRNISRKEASRHIFGYACLIDVVIRGKEERVMRKAYDTFCPVGPYITTVDEAPHYEMMEMELSVNGEIRQQAKTRQLIVDVPEMIALASAVMTLHPGDIIASGTPAGVGPFQHGDKVDIHVHGVGQMSIDVVQGDIGNHPVWNK